VSRIRLLLAILLAALASACARGPDEAGLSRDLQQRLDALFGGPVLVLRSLNRQGSAPIAAAEDGARQVIVYFNARLEFAEAYDPSDWEGISPKLVAAALGATDSGITFLSGGRMMPGTELLAHGSLVYRREGDGWRPTDAGLPQPVAAKQDATGASDTRTGELIRRLAQLVDTSPVPRELRERVVAEELDRALQNIQLRLDVGNQAIVVATGPQDGEYARFMGSIRTRLGGRGVLETAYTEGSLANAFMIDRGQARFALVQSDVVQAAAGGEGLFAVTGPLRRIRAVAALFPEPLHVVVRADSGLTSVAQLAGRRVSLGAPGSGTRYTALQMLAAHGLGMDSITEVATERPADALRRLADGSLDAVVEVVSAPWGALLRMGDRSGFVLLPLEPDAIEAIVAGSPAIVPLVIPARTYPGQEQPVQSAGPTALLVANADTPAEVVGWMLDAMFAASDAPGRGVSASRLSRERALTGVTVPLHEGAEQYFGVTAARP
jgi:TRAP transporter TAXI family solute receptor